MAFVLISKQEKPVDKDAEESQVIYLFKVCYLVENVLALFHCLVKTPVELCISWFWVVDICLLAGKRGRERGHRCKCLSVVYCLIVWVVEATYGGGYKFTFVCVMLTGNWWGSCRNLAWCKWHGVFDLAMARKVCGFLIESLHWSEIRLNNILRWFSEG